VNETAQGTKLIVTQVDENTREYRYEDANGNKVNPDGSPISQGGGGSSNGNGSSRDF
jgi:hypothetical protein